jgi:hypothetical protein
MLRKIFACFTIDVNLDEGEANKAEAACGRRRGRWGRGKKKGGRRKGEKKEKKERDALEKRRDA